MDESQLKIGRIRVFDTIGVVCLLSIMAIMLSRYTYELPDYVNYSSVYSYVGVSGVDGYGQVEIGFKYLCLLFYRMGFDYEQFHFWITLFGIILIYFSIKKITNIRALALLMYMIFPFVLDVVQFRNFIASVIVISALNYVLVQNKKSDVLKYIVFIFLAITIQATAAYYLILIFLKKNSIRLDVIVAFITLMLIIPMTIRFTNLIGGNSFLSKYAVYVGNSVNRYSVMMVGILFLLNIFILIQIGKGLENSIYHNLIGLNILMLPIIGTMFINIDMFRIIRNIIIINNCFVINNLSIRRSNKIAIICYFMIFIIFLYIFLLFSNSDLIKIIL